MSFRRNVLANYVSQIYVTLIGIVMVPVYVRYMGAEAYGLVGFFSMLQAWFQMLDIGLTPTLSRETARFAGGALDGFRLRNLLRSLEGIFAGIAALGLVVMIVASDLVARDWLQLQQLPITEVRSAVMLMAGTVAFRWISGLYRGAVNGFEQMVWLSSFNMAVATARFVLVIPIFIYVGSGPEVFFAYQLLIALAEMLALWRKTYRSMPPAPRSQKTSWHWEPLRDVFKFSLSIAFTTSIWIIVTQTDKLLLSKILPLSEYGFFTLAVILASGVMFISTPITRALSPRMTKLSAETDDAGLVKIYRVATQLVCVIAIPTSLTLAVFAEPVLWAWTGRQDIAQNAAPALALYSLGNGILALSAFPAHLQFATGRMRLHVIGNALFVLLLIPSLIVATKSYGTKGAGMAWLASNLIYFLVWVPLVHRKFIKGTHLKWLIEDVSFIALAAIFCLVVCSSSHILTNHDTRLRTGLTLLMVGGLTVCAAAAASSFVRASLYDVLQRSAKALTKKEIS